MTLKAEREERNRQAAQEAYEKQFRLQSDELRTKTSKLRCWKIAHGGRLNQLEEHKIMEIKRVILKNMKIERRRRLLGRSME